MNISKKKIQIICPVYNEEEMIELFYNELSRKVLIKLEVEYSINILFVLDKSSDNSFNILKKLSDDDKRIQILHLSRRFGHQMSLVAGIDNSEADIIIMMDSDLQHPPELIFEMIEKYNEGYEVVYTIRRKPEDSLLLKRSASKLFYKIMGYFSDIELKSGEADFRLISSNVANVFKNQIRENNQFLRGLFNWVGFKRIGVHYSPNIRKAGSSKYSWSGMFSFAMNGITSFSRKPLKIAIFIGLLFFLMGLTLLVYTVFIYFIKNDLPPGWATTTILISLFGGIQLLFLGIIGEYIGQIFDEVKNRPLYIIEDKINI